MLACYSPGIAAEWCSITEHFHGLHCDGHHGSKLNVACGRSDAIAVIDTASNAKLAEIAVGALPWGVAIR